MSHTSWPFGGDNLFSSTNATPAFFMDVTWRDAPTAAASSPSTCGACPKHNTVDTSFSRASARENGSGLCRANVRAAEHQVRLNPQTRNSLGHLLRFLDAFFG